MESESICLPYFTIFYRVFTVWNVLRWAGAAAMAAAAANAGIAMCPGDIWWHHDEDESMEKIGRTSGEGDIQWMEEILHHLEWLKPYK